MDEFGLLLFGVELELGFEVLFGFEEFISVLLELLLLELGLVESVLEGVLEVLELLDGELLVLEGDVEFISELLLVEDDGEVEVLEPVWLDWVDGEL